MKKSVAIIDSVLDGIIFVDFEEYQKENKGVNYSTDILLWTSNDETPKLNFIKAMRFATKENHKNKLIESFIKLEKEIKLQFFEFIKSIEIESEFNKLWSDLMFIDDVENDKITVQ